MKEQGRVNIFCYLEPFTPCAASNNAVHVAVSISGRGSMTSAVDNPTHARLGGFWYEAQVLKFMWVLTPTLRAYVKAGHRAIDPPLNSLRSLIRREAY